MNAKNWAVAAAWAVVSFAAALAVFGPANLNAVDSALKPEITHPKMTVGGAELMLQIAGDSALKAGDKPTLELHAANTTDQPIKVTVDLRMTATEPVSEMSRMMPRATEVWKDQRPLEIAPHQTVTVQIPSGQSIPEKKSVSVMMSCDKQRVSLPLVVVKRERDSAALRKAAAPAKSAVAKQPSSMPAVAKQKNADLTQMAQRQAAR